MQARCQLAHSSAGCCPPAADCLQVSSLRRLISHHHALCRAMPQGMDQPAAGVGAAGDNLVGALLSTIDFSEPMSFDGEEKTE